MPIFLVVYSRIFCPARFPTYTKPYSTWVRYLLPLRFPPVRHEPFHPTLTCK